MTSRPSFPLPDYDNVFGVDRAGITRLAALQRRAHAGDITLRRWQRDYAAVLENYPGAIDLVGYLWGDWYRQAFEPWTAPHGEAPEPWSEMPFAERMRQAEQLVDDFDALTPPPAVDDLQRLLIEADEQQQRMPERPGLFDLKKERLCRWLEENDRRPRDPWSGLVQDLTEDDHLDSVRAACHRFRTAIERHDDLPEPMKHFPLGACGDTSELLGQYLADTDHGTWLYVMGHREHDGQTHAWLEANEVLVDITADQFDVVTDPVVVTRDRTWHDREFPRASVPRPAGLAYYSDGPRAEAMSQLFEVLRTAADRAT